MTWEVGCPHEKTLIDGEKCRTCFYKRLDSDISTLWCRYNNRMKQIRNMKGNIRRAENAEADMQRYIDSMYAQGRTRKAEQGERNFRQIRQNQKQLIRRLDAVKKIMSEAHTINTPLISAIEDYLNSLTRKNDIAEKILAPDKSLSELYTILRDEAITDPDAAIKRALEYYDITI